MKRNTLRLVIVLAILCIVGITVTQLYWVQKAFNLVNDQFERDVNIALHNVAEHFFEISHLPPPKEDPIQQLSSNYYVVMVNSEIDVQQVEAMLKAEFSKRDIAVDFEYGIYDCNTDKMVYGNYVSLDENEADKSRTLPKWNKQNYYFGVNFPTMGSYLINRMGIWIFSTVVLLFVILFFAYTLFVIFRQKRLSEIQKDFINNMTHEFKTPISTIAIATEVLKHPGIVHSPERLLNYATIIQNENQRLKKQVERVLQIAALDKEDIGLKKEKLNLHELVKHAIANIELSFEDKKPEIHYEFHAKNPFLMADRLHLTNIVYNLLDNAIKYCKEVPKIHISTENKGAHLGLTVKDNGIGIAEEHLRKVFSKFYRVPTGNVHDVKGFGLGLHYVAIVIRAHGGTFDLSSSLGNGATFSFVLPQDQ